MKKRIRPTNAGTVVYKGKVLPPIAGGAGGSRDQAK